MHVYIYSISFYLYIYTVNISSKNKHRFLHCSVFFCWEQSRLSNSKKHRPATWVTKLPHRNKRLPAHHPNNLRVEGAKHVSCEYSFLIECMNSKVSISFSHPKYACLIPHDQSHPWFQRILGSPISLGGYIPCRCRIFAPEPSDHHGDETINVVQPWMTIGHLGPQFQLGNNFEKHHKQIHYYPQISNLRTIHW